MAFSIVIICRDEEDIIGNCLSALRGLTDDVIVLDTGSTDRTIEIVKAYPVTLIEHPWSGYGPTKNYANLQAKYDWILSLDADEVLDEELYESLSAWDTSATGVYWIKRVNHIGGRSISYGHLKPELKPRLFNKNIYQWDDRPVHELLTPAVPKNDISMLKGVLLHYQAEDMEDLSRQYEKYALLTPTKKGIVKRLAPYYHFIRSYVIMLGFIEGETGYQLAKLYKRYHHLRDKN